ncbi:MAG: EcoKI restriction-modification system protein HsdS [bacterium ADurb.Bin212]|nr:MAG: EcoKI restriction-modification system protein HsdS [bacterium ADurb.Bin212]
MENNKSQQNIPDGWQEVRLDKCLTIKHGKSQHEIEVPEGEYPILASGGVIGRTNTPLYSKPSVLIGRKGTIDRPQFMDSPFWTVDTLFYSQVKDGYSAKYLYYLFLTINWKKYSEQSGLPSLSAATISSIKVNIPLPAEQNRIVAVLETWDNAIQLLEKKISIIKNQKRWFSCKLLSRKLRLPGYKDDWIQTTLEGLAGSGNNIVDGPFGSNLKNSDYVESGIPVLQGQNITGDKFNTSGFRYVTAQKAREVYRSNAIVDDILTVKIGSVGFSAIIDGLAGNEYAIIPANLIRIRCRNTNTDPRLIYYLLTSRNGKRKLKELASGNAQPALSLGNVRKMKFLVPQSKNEQEAIANIFNTIDREILLLSKKLEKFIEQKKYLLNNLITGNIRTPENLKIDKPERD